jgi:hypothetical protein
VDIHRSSSLTKETHWKRGILFTRVGNLQL